MWIRFFVGTPQRFIVTLVSFIALLAFVNLYPGLLSSACEQLMVELTPLFVQVANLVFVVVVFCLMLKAMLPRK
jgi:hypothetical protein